MPISKFLVRNEKIKSQQLQVPQERREEPPETSSAVPFLFLLFLYSHPLEHTYCNNCSKARTWKEERKRLMRMNKYPPLIPREYKSKEFSNPWGLLHSHPPSPSECIWYLKCTNPRFTHTKVPRVQIWNLIKVMPLSAPPDSSQLGKDRDRP